MIDFPILSILMSLPLVSILAISFTEEEKHIPNIKWASLWTTLMVFVTTLILFSLFDSKQPGLQFVERYTWVSAYGLEYHVGVSDLSLFFILYSTLLFPIAILASWNKIKVNIKLYMSCLLLLETLVIGAFSSLNLVLFCFCCESIAVPAFMIIGLWGGLSEIRRIFKLFLYLLWGALLIFFLIMGLSAIFVPPHIESAHAILSLVCSLPPSSLAAASLLIGLIVGGVYRLVFFKDFISKDLRQEKK